MTVNVLSARKAEQAEHRMAIGAGWSGEHDLVFTQANGQPLDPESVGQVFNRRVARCELPRIPFHGLRHSHVAHLIAAGEQPLLIARRLGHHSASFSLDRYGHLLQEAGEQAASAVGAMVYGSAQ
jgi:integrase